MNPGDIVTIGPWAPSKVSWEILRIDQAAPGFAYASLRSGMTGRSATVPLERLHPWAPIPKEKK